MSFVLHLLFAESPLESIAEAAGIVHEQWSVPPKGHLFGRFRSWQGGMVEACPDLSGEDPDGDRPDNAWPEGLPARFEQSVYTFRPNVGLLDAGLMGLIAEGAALCGLHVLDPQNGLLYRPDRRVLDRQGRLHPAPKSEVPAVTRTHLIREADAQTVIEPLREQLAGQLAAHGFALEHMSGRPRIVRKLGECTQVIDAGGFFSHGELALSACYRLYCARVTAAWVPVLRDAYARYMATVGKRLGGRVDDFDVSAEELCGPAADAYGRYRFGHAKTVNEARRWFDGLREHIETQALPVLDGTATPRRLADLMLTDRQSWRLQTKNDVRPTEIFGRLVLIYAFDRPRAEKWLEDIATHAGRSNGFHFSGWPQASASIERLRAHLASPAFDPSTLA